MRLLSLSKGVSRCKSISRLGFTLIEVLIVMFILAAMLGMITLQLTRSDRDLLRDEADQLSLLLLSARDEAVLRGELIAFEMSPAGYRFLRVGEQGTFVAFDDGPLSPRDFPADMRVRFEIEGQPTTGRRSLMFDPSNAVPAFRIGFTLNETDWWIQGGQDGKIRSVPKIDDKRS